MLMKIPDNPPTTGYKRANNNSLTEWVSYIHQARREMLNDDTLPNDDQSLEYKNVEAPAALGGDWCPTITQEVGR